MTSKPTKRAVQAAIREVMPGAKLGEWSFSCDQEHRVLFRCDARVLNVMVAATGVSKESARQHMLAFCEALKAAHEACRSAQLAESFEKGAQDMARARRTQGNSQARRKV